MNDFRWCYVVYSSIGSNCADKDAPPDMKVRRLGPTEKLAPSSDTLDRIARTVGSVMPQLLSHTLEGELHALR